LNLAWNNITNGVYMLVNCEHSSINNWSFDRDE